MAKPITFKAVPPMNIVRAKYKALIKKVKNGRGRNKLAAVFLDQWVQKNFTSSGGKVGGWKPLAAGGRWKKKKFDPSAKVLMDTGRLRLSFSPYSTNKTAGIFSALDYAKKHNEGEDGLPVRRMLPKQSEVKAPLRKIYEKDLKNKFKRFRLA